MAKITLDGIRHSYTRTNSSSNNHSNDWALKEINISCLDGGAYALLGPSGCGKTTLLNIISGILTPTEGRVLFDNIDVTPQPSEKREIAQVFQFPVIYDTMTVFDNLAFPLKNRKVPKDDIHKRVNEIAAMLDLQETLHDRASGLTADGKQKISLGRGLVRDNVNVIMFDEPLTVIDPHLKWQLRSKLKELHQQLGVTMIYVTHDQTEALTFADNVIVMQDGVIVQIGTPVELFEKPSHTFVGHFIGSPGMNVLPCKLLNENLFFNEYKIKTESPITPKQGFDKLELGIRPEFISFRKTGLAVEIIKVSETGRYRIVETVHNNHIIKLLVPEGQNIPTEQAYIHFDPNHTHIYVDDWILE